MDIVQLSANQIKSLLALATERGLPPPFTEQDVDSVMESRHKEPSDLNEVACIRQLTKLHRMVHELLYAPPGRG